MSAVVSLASTALAGAARISPRLAARIALPLMMHVGPRMKVRTDQRATHEAAQRSEIVVRGKRIAVYEWLAGPQAVLLVHGWRGRAAQFAALVRELRSEGFTVVAFDAPANGDSPGHTTNAFEYAEAIAQLELRHGGFHAIVGHSFGALSAFVALSHGVQTRRLVSIAGVPDAEFLLHSFAQIVRLPDASRDALNRRFVQRICAGDPQEFARLSGVRNPAPAQVPLLIVHDRDDAQVPASAGLALAAAASGPATVLETIGFGHNRILAADPVLDAVTAFIAAPDAAATSPAEAAAAAAAAAAEMSESAP